MSDPLTPEELANLQAIANANHMSGEQPQASNENVHTETVEADQGTGNEPLADVQSPSDTAQPGNEDAAVPEAETPVHTHESILTALMLDLEGMAHLAKSEVEAIVTRARELFEKL